MAKPTKQDARTRRETLEALRRQQRAAERRKTLLIVGAAIVVGLALLAYPVYQLIDGYVNDPARQSASEFGVAASAASCDTVTEDPTTGTADHVEEGTVIDYAQVPPSSGQHYATPAAFGRTFYTEDDRLPMEQLVHNLEHGYTLLWYSSDASDSELADIEALASNLADAEETGGKFIASPWDDSYGELPEGKRFALSHWGADSGHRQLCGAVSGEVVESFVQAYPFSDSPEPNAA